MPDSDNQSWTDHVKQNPVKSAATFLALITTLFTMGWAVDNRYANAGEIQAVHQEISRFRSSFIEDKIFELRFKKQEAKNSGRDFRPLDAAMLRRYENQLQGSPRVQSHR